MIFIDLSNDSFVITEFEYFFAVFIYDFSVLSGDLVFVNDYYFSNLLLYYFTQAIVISQATVFMLKCKPLNC